MKPRTRSQIRLIGIAFAAMLCLLALLLWQGVRRGDAVRVGVPKSACAYGAAMLLQAPGAQYSCVLGSTPQALYDALEEGTLDAALLPYALATQAKGCDIRAVLGFESLVVLARDQALLVPHDLHGRALTLPAEMAGTRAERMLRTVLKQNKIDCALAFDSDARADLLCCDIDTAASLMQSDTALRVCFTIGRAWQKTLRSTPPAGLCLVVRQDYLDRAGSDYAAFEKALASAQRYGADKRKKTVAMVAAAGLAKDEALADALYDACDFEFLTDAEMRAALQALP